MRRLRVLCIGEGLRATQAPDGEAPDDDEDQDRHHRSDVVQTVVEGEFVEPGDEDVGAAGVPVVGVGRTTLREEVDDPEVVEVGDEIISSGGLFGGTSDFFRELKSFGVKKILPCHCSGEEFMNHFGARLSSGSVIVLE